MNFQRAWRLGLMALALWTLSGGAWAASLGSRSALLPPSEEIWRVLSLRDYNTRVVVAGAAMLGAAAGLVGTFLLLRKRALLSDAVSHATLPGVALAFMLMAGGGGSGKNLFGLLLGAAVTGTLGMLAVVAIRRWSRLKDDAALGIVLSVFFGAGVALMSLATRMERGNAAGLNSFIYGKAASMLMSDAIAIGLAALFCALACALLFKEFAALCFDQGFAASQGWPVALLDVALMALAVVVTVIGLQAVGLILVVALLIVPPAAARFWTSELKKMALCSAGIGAGSGLLGSMASALLVNLPAGAVIVLAAASFFAFSLVFGAERGVLRRAFQQGRLGRKIARQNLLRAMSELTEAKAAAALGSPNIRAWREKPTVHSFSDLLPQRTWPRWSLRRAIAKAERDGLLRESSSGGWELTAQGQREARQVIRNHRLWETYLIAFADIAPSHVDRDADAIEHVLDEELIALLESRIREADAAQAAQRAAPEPPMPPSPHELALALANAEGTSL